jgi:hypothetical protein
MKSNRRNIRRARREMRRNPVFGKDLISEVLLPVSMGSVAYLATKWAGGFVAESKFPVVGESEQAGVTTAAIAASLTALWFADTSKESLVAESLQAILVGSSMAAALPLLQQFTKVAQAEVNASLTTPAPVAPPATSGVGQFYGPSSLGLGIGYDISHYGAPYKGMLGLGSNDEVSAFGLESQPEAFSTVIPTDVAVPATNWPEFKKVSIPFTQEPLWTGGSFSRNLFTTPGL